MKRSILGSATTFTVAVFVAVAAGACGATTSNGAPGSGSASGTVGGVSLTVADVLAVSAGGTPGVDASYMLVDLFDIPNVCSMIRSLPNNADKGNYTTIQLEISPMVGTTPRPVVVGTYSIGAPTGGPSGGEATIFANAFLVKSDAQCMSVVPSTDTQATSGTITITSMSASGVVGSYSATFKDGTISGAFNALFCTLPDSGAPMSDDAGGPTCVQ